MSAYKRLTDLVKICSVLPALAIMPAFADDIQWSGNKPFTVETDKSMGGGVLRVPVNNDEYTLIDVPGGISGNKIVLTKSDSDANKENDVYGQGAAIYNLGLIGTINADFTNNGVENTSNIAGKATANGGAIAAYSGSQIDEINGDFIGNYVSAVLDEKVESREYADTGKMVSAGGGAIHIEGKWVDNNQASSDITKIGTINGNFESNSATGDAYANGGAIYVKGGTKTPVEIGTINGGFKSNTVTALTEQAVGEASTGGAISIKVDGDKDATVTVNGDFETNSVTTNATDALGGAIYNEGTLTVNGAFKGNKVVSETGAANGGALYNVGTTTLGADTSFTMNEAGFAGAIWNEGELVFNNGTSQMTFGDNKATGSSGGGGAIYNKGNIDEIAHTLFVKNEGYNGGAINNTSQGDGGTIGTIRNTSFMNNIGGNGGAVRNQNTITKLDTVLFEGNVSGNGGAFWNGSLGSVVESMTNVRFVNNMAITENVNQQGGAITNAGKIGLIDKSEFTGNQAGKQGGAIANVGNQANDFAEIKLNDTTFEANVAGEFGGAIYNEKSGVITMSGDNVFSNNYAGGQANDIHNLGTVTINGGTTKLTGGITGDTGKLTVSGGAVLDIGTSTIVQNSVTFDGSTLVASLLNSDNYGKIDADSISVSDSTLKLNIGGAGTYNIFGTDDVDFTTVDFGDVYNVTDGTEAGEFIVTTKSVDEIAKNTGLSTQGAASVAGLANSNNAVLNAISLRSQQELAAGNVGYVEQETAKLNPDDKPVAQSVASSVQNQVLSLAAGRMAGGAVGRSGGDSANMDYGIWAQGLYNHAKHSDKFTGDTMGISVGADALINGKYTIGVGYAYNDTDVDSNSRDTTIDSSSLFVYGQYKPSQWFVNGTLNYTMSNYTEKSNLYGAFALESEYDVDSFGGQIMTGYDFASGLTPMVGARYLHISQDEHESAIGTVKDMDTDYLTGVAGVKYAFDIESQARLKFRPEISAAATYDFLSDAAVSTVVAPGNVSYVIDADRLSRFGGEFGIGLTAMYEGWEFSVNYELDLHEDYTSQTGMLKFRYDF